MNKREANDTTDLIVAGSGMGGLVAGVRAARKGARVVVVEKGPRPGGSMYLSGGGIWTFTALDDVREDVPDGDPQLQALLVETFDQSIEWLRELGIQVTELESGPIGDPPRHRRVVEIDPPAFTDAMIDRLEEANGELRLQTSLEGLSIDDQGVIDGARVRTLPTGTGQVIAAPAVVLATGGFQGNEQLVEQYLDVSIDCLWLRSNPWSTGDGFLAALDVGAKATPGLDTFYGYNLVAPPASFGPTEFLEASQKYGQAAIALAADGTRFADETASNFGETLAQATAAKANGRAFLVVDADLYNTTLDNGGHVGTAIERAADLGGQVTSAPSLAQLGDALTSWGVNGSRAVRTIRQFNEFVRTDRTDRLQVPRRGHRVPMDRPPFHAVAVQPGITFTMGGLDVDTEMRVLRRAATSATYDQGYVPERADHILEGPIEGLYAAGVDVGNVSHRYYIGGLSQALVTGWIAGERAADYARNA